ncbi:MAG: TIR domain-containing protein, partial [Alistipes sp.]|nr:TIR domain-containing protein [Alistipes sp.]
MKIINNKDEVETHMNLENVKYDAFISYRHCELDKFVAVNLHKQLEAFKIPKSLIKAGKTNGKTKIERVFRDQDELPLTNNLADPITRALQGSEFLIVICSPRLKESKWCLTEIETFISMHGRDHILAVLIEGEPADSFPEILRFEERVITDEYGYTRLEKFEVEPLAADVRGQNKSEILKKIKSELLRLVAPMLNCNYDDLKMRHKEARQKKILRVSFAISLVCLIFTAISTTMALTIHKQANTIEEQYHTALKDQAISHASISQTLLKKEDRMAAIAVARMVLPDSLDNQTEKAYTPAAEFALSDSLAIYNNGEKNFPVKSLEQNSPIRFMIVSPDETTITTVNTNGIITIFDIATASVVDSFTTSDDGLANVYNENEIAYLGSNKLAYLGFNGFYIYDISTKKDEFYNLDVTTNYISTSSDGEYIGISADDSFEIYDKNGKNVYSHPFPSTHTGDSAISFNTEKKLCAFTCTSNEKDTPYGFIYVINYGTSEEIYSKQLDIASFSKCAFYGEQLIVVGEKHYNLGDSLMDFSIDTHIYAFPLDSNTINWEFVKKDVVLDEVTGATQWENRTLVVSNYDEITFISSHDGSVIHTTTLGSSIVDITPLVQEGSVLANTARGEEMLVEAIVTTASYIRREADRFVMTNLSESALAKGRDSYELLKLAPGVWADDNGSISINGKSGAKVLINEREVRMTNEQLMSYLRSLPAENLQRIEIIPQSGADFDADSSAGVIKITLRRQRDGGTTGSVSLAWLGSTTTPSYNLSPSANINHKSGPLNLYGNINLADYNVGYTDDVITRESTHYDNGAELNSTTSIESAKRSGGGMLGAIWDLSERSSLGVEYNMWHNP